MPRFVKWSKKLKTQEYRSVRLGVNYVLILDGDVKSGQFKGPTLRFETAEETKAAYDAEISKLAKSKFWTRIDVPEVPTAKGETVSYTRDGFGWKLEVLDATSLETTTLRSGEPAGGNVWKLDTTLERDAQAELLIAEKIATGYVREGSSEKSPFTATGYFESKD